MMSGPKPFEVDFTQFVHAVGQLAADFYHRFVQLFS